MNKFAKGGIAAGVGVVLLLGGGGTFALWNDAANLDGGTIVSGRLALNDTSFQGAWYRYDASKTSLADYTSPLPADYKIVPGDELVYVGKGLGLTAEGGRLAFQVSVNLDQVTGQDAAFTVDQSYLGGVQEVTAPAPVLPAPVGGTYTVTTANGQINATLDAGVKVTFAADGTDAQNATLDLAAATVKVTQVPAA